MATPSDDITLRDILAHIQAMKAELLENIGDVKKQLATLAKKVDSNEVEAQRRHKVTMTALDNIDARVDDIEIVQLPKIKEAVGLS